MRILAKLTLILIVSQLIGCGEPQVSTAAESEALTETATVTGPRFLFLGDSITAGLHLDAGLEEAFPAQAARMAAEKGRPFSAINAGVSGDTTAGGLRRLDWVMKTDPQLIIIELGGNDGLRGQPIAEIRANLEALIERCREKDVQVLLLGMLMPPSYGSYAEDFAKIYVDLAAEKNLLFLPAFMEGVGGHPELNYKDGLHPNSRGHLQLAKKLIPVLLPLIESMKNQEKSAKSKG